MYKSNKIFFLLFLFLQTNFLFGVANPLDFSVEDFETLREEFVDFKKDNSFLDLDNELKNELLDLKVDSVNDFSTDSFFLKNFRNKSLLKFTLGKIASLPIKFEFSGEDILRLSLLSADILNDKKFIDHFVNNYNNLVVNKILDDSEQTISILKEEFKHEDIYNYIKKNHLITSSDFFKTDLFRNTLYLFVAELVRIFKDVVFKERSLSFDACFRNDVISSKNPIIHIFYGLPIHISSLFEIALNSVPERNKLNIYLLNTVLQGFAYFYSLEGFEKPEFSKGLKFYYKSLNSYFFILFKEIFAVSSTFKFFDKDIYAKARSFYFYKNKTILINLLEKYNNLKNHYTKRTKLNNKLFLELEDELKKHIEYAHEIDFKSWVRIKNNVISRKKIFIGWFVHIPTFILISYNFFKYYKSNYSIGV